RAGATCRLHFDTQSACARIALLTQYARCWRHAAPELPQLPVRIALDSSVPIEHHGRTLSRLVARPVGDLGGVRVSGVGEGDPCRCQGTTHALCFPRTAAEDGITHIVKRSGYIHPMYGPKLPFIRGAGPFPEVGVDGCLVSRGLRFRLRMSES